MANLTFVARCLFKESDNRAEHHFTILSKRFDCVANSQVTDGNLLSRSELNLRLGRKACCSTGLLDIHIDYTASCKRRENMQMLVSLAIVLGYQ